MKEPKGVDYEWVSSKLNLLRVTQPDGSIAFSSWDRGVSYEDLISLIGTHHTFDKEIPDVERRRIIGRAVSAAAKAGDITGKSLKGQILKHANEFRNLPKTDVVMLTSISMKRPSDLVSSSIDGANITFTDGLPEGFSREGLTIYKGWEPPRDLPQGYTVVRVEVKARSEFEAFDLGIDALDLLRGIWNYSINRLIMSRTSSGPARAVNSIRLGPVHTLHKPSGELFADTFWYEPISPPERDPWNLRDWARMKKEEVQIRSLMDNLLYREFMREAFIRYARSLDTDDHESSFLKLWSLLEFLTAIKEDENYGEVIKRVLFLYADEEYHRQILEHLRARRNATVHRGESSGEVETFIFQLKLYVEFLMNFHLSNGSTYRSAEEAGLLLSKPRDPNELKKLIEMHKFQISLHETALKLHEKRVQNVNKKDQEKPSTDARNSTAEVAGSGHDDIPPEAGEESSTVKGTEGQSEAQRPADGG